MRLCLYLMFFILFVKNIDTSRIIVYNHTRRENVCERYAGQLSLYGVVDCLSGTDCQFAERC